MNKILLLFLLFSSSLAYSQQRAQVDYSIEKKWTINADQLSNKMVMDVQKASLDSEVIQAMLSFENDLVSFVKEDNDIYVKLNVNKQPSWRKAEWQAYINRCSYQIMNQ